MLLFSRMMMVSCPSLAAVASSFPVIMKPPSPTRTIGLRFGNAHFAPTPPGTPKPMLA